MKLFIWMYALLFVVSCSLINNPSLQDETNPTIITEESIHQEPTLLPTLATLTALTVNQENFLTTITPDANLIDNWRDYEIAIGEAFFPSPLELDEIICEWDILSIKDQNIYTYAVCSGYYDAENLSTGSMPAVIILDREGKIKGVKTTGNTPSESFQDAREKLFPPDVLEILHDYRNYEMHDHLLERREKAMPPLIIIRSMQE